VLVFVGVVAVALGLGAWLLAAGVFKTKGKTPDGEAVELEVGKSSPIRVAPEPIQATPKEEAVIALEIDQAGAQVWVDGQKVAIAIPGGNKPAGVKAEPGRHTLRISKDGFEVVTREVELKAGQSAPIRVTLEPTAKPPSLVVLPVSVTLKAGETRAFAIHVQRRRVEGPIEVRASGLPDKVTAKPTTVPAGQDSAQMELSLAPGARAADLRSGALLLARCADVRAEGPLVIQVSEEPSLAIQSVADVTLLAGETRTIEVRVRRTLCEGAVQVRVAGLPAAVTARPVIVPAVKDVASINLTAAPDSAAAVTAAQVVATLENVKTQSPLQVIVKALERLKPAGRVVGVIEAINANDRVLRLSVGAPQPAGGAGPATREYKISPQARVRLSHPPMAFDDKGNIKKWTAAELQALKGPGNLPGYTAELSDLRAKQTVSLELGKGADSVPQITQILIVRDSP
jgi:hypothetical protein